MELLTATEKGNERTISIPVNAVQCIRELKGGNAVIFTTSYNWETAENHDTILGRYRMAAGIA